MQTNGTPQERRALYLIEDLEEVAESRDDPFTVPELVYADNGAVTGVRMTAETYATILDWASFPAPTGDEVVMNVEAFRFLVRQAEENQ